MTATDTHWRPAYEVYAVAAWGGVAVVSVWVVSTQTLPTGPFWCALAYAILRLVRRFASAIGVWRRRLCLNGKAVEWITTEHLIAKMKSKPGHVWLGWGFDWTREHMQRLYELEKMDIDKVLLPAWLTGGPKPEKGSALLHGVEPREHDIFVPIRELAGHVFVPATTGTIKTRLLALLAVQAIHRKPRETVIVIDLKGDIELKELIKRECASAGRSADFANFHPAFPDKSVRWDPVRQFVRTPGIASRVGALFTGAPGLDPFAAFGWRVVYQVSDGFVETLKEPPNLVAIRRYVEGGVDQLLHNTIVHVLEEEGTDWRVAIEPYLKKVKRYKRPSPSTPDETMALVAYYKSERQSSDGVGVIDGLISMFEHNREHAQKMLASIIPILTMLTAGELAGLLSPDRNDPADPRPILDGAKIVESGTVLYAGLDGLSDSVIAQSLASICLADIAAQAGARYLAGVHLPEINLFVDEANEAANAPFIQLLNKSRAAGFRVTFMSQNVSDFIARLGSEALARQVLGNANTVIAGRIKDKITSEYTMEAFGKTILRHIRTTQGTTPVPHGEFVGYGSSYGEQVNEILSELVRPEHMGRLPDLEYFASFSGGKIQKGRIPLIRMQSA